MQSEARKLLASLREKLPGVRAFVLLGSAGELLTYAAEGPPFDVDVFSAEYATLLRIARSASEDSGMGDLVEQILISSTATIVVERCPPDRFGIFVCSPDEQLGRLRYELKRSLLYSTLPRL